MKFKVVGKRLILTDYSHEITNGENSFDAVEIAVPRYHDDCDISTLSFRFSEISEDGENSAAQVLCHTKCDEKYIYLKGTITSDFSAITGNVIFTLTGVNGENVVAKFQSAPYAINDDISLASLPNETIAEQLFNQAQLEVQKAIEAAERAEKASQTPAPAEIYPATKERLGGVLSGKDISVDGNGNVTVNSINGKSLENEIADVKSSQKSTSNLAVQIAHPNNFLIYDDIGKPSVMVAIPKFYLDEVIDGASHTVHPAFIINGVEQNVIYISKYLNIVENERAYSLPMKNPATYITLEQAWNSCKNKGAGWHLMTNSEWAAIALWCKKNGTMPKGNNNYGKDISETDLPQKAIPASRDSSGKIVRTLTGSGSESWYHNGTFTGITDLNGNVWEYITGLRLVNGEIQIIPNNDIAAESEPIVFGQSTLWKAIMPDNSLAETGTNGTLKYDVTSTSCCLNTITSSRLTTTVKFNSISSEKNINVPEYMKALTLFPAKDDNYGDDSFLVSNSGTVIPVAGGKHSMENNSGVFCKSIGNHSTNADITTGFRCAYYEPN